MGYKRKLNTLPIYHTSKLRFNHELRHGSTRQDDKFAVIKVNALLKINSLNFRIGSAWNSALTDIKNVLNPKILSEKSFLLKIKRLFLQSYNVPCTIMDCYICKR